MSSDTISASPAHNARDMFNLSPSSKWSEMDLESEARDQVGDMLMSDAAMRSDGPNSLAAATLRQSRSRTGSSWTGQKTEALSQMEKASGRRACNIKVSKNVFKQAYLGRTGSSVIAARLFDLQEPDADGTVPADRLADAMFTLEHASLEDQLRITFQLLDTRSDGTISTADLNQTLQAAFTHVKLEVSEPQLHRVSEALAREIHSGAAPGAASHPHAAHHNLTYDSGSTAAEEQHFIKVDDLVKHVMNYINSTPESPRQHHDHSVWFSMKRNGGRLLRQRLLLWYTLFWLGMAGSFVAGYVQNWKAPLAEVSGAAYPLAKAFAQVIQPISFLLLIAVCRRTITALRSTPLKWVLPLDECIGFHRVCGYVLVVCALGHTVAHIGNFICWTSASYGAKWGEVFNADQHSKSYYWVDQTAITGFIMWAALLVGLPFALYYPRMASYIRETVVGKFLNNFLWFSISHMTMWLVFYVALILHPMPGLPSQHKNHRGTTWIYCALPLLIYIAEKIYRFLWPFAVSGELLDVELLPGKEPVVVLRMRRPRGFVYRPGMYTFVNVPSISRSEWHPFTISSAPGDAFVSVHICQKGDWTMALIEAMKVYCEEVEKSLNAESPKHLTEGSINLALGAEGRSFSLARALSTNPQGTPRVQSPPEGVHYARAQTFGRMKGTLLRHRTRASMRSFDWGPLPNAPLVLLDGPYSAPAQTWEDYDVLLLVGTGIGVTPFASIMADLVNRLESRPCTACGSENVGCRACDHAGCRLFGDGTGMTVEKVYFHWVVGDHQAPNYIASTLETISKDDQLNLIEPRIHVTSFKPNKKETDLHYVLAKLGQDALHEQRGVDIVTGLQSKVVTEFGRPDWPKILAHIAAENPGQTVGVFFCGAPMLGKTIKDCCYDWNAGSTRRRRVADSTGDVEAQHPVLEKTIFHFYEEFF
mmetsp:Transcript_19749/g.59648  ORF Transcript_19749/g.59648 Transcript_19749/m.59648 type:complete len:932 (-) Transcript_19749:862-3657(-)